MPHTNMPRSASSTALAFAAVMLVALNLRPAITSVSPVLSRIGEALQMSPFGLGVLTTLPVLFLGLAAPIAPRAAARIGVDRAVLVAIIVLALSLLIRPYLGVVGLLVGTAVAGGCIGVMGVLLPGIVKRDYPASVSLLTGLYTAVLCTGASFAAGATEPLRVVLAPLLSAVPADAGSGVWVEVLFDAWRGALAFWFIPVLLAGVVWWSQLGRKHPPRKAARPLTPLYRNALAWQVTLFMGLQSSLAYSVFGWLPSILQSRGLDPVAAGLALSASIMIQIITAIALPWIASRMRDQRAMITLAMGLTLTGIGGCIYAPVSGVWFWIVILGLGQGGAFSLALTLLVVRAEDADTAARLSGMAQGVGYTLAALGPLLLGLLHDQFGGWKIAGILLGVITLLALANGLAAGRDRLVSA